MENVQNVKPFFQDQAHSIGSEVWEIAKKIGEHPELGYQEFYAVGLFELFLRRHGFTFDQGVAGLETAFVASFQGSRPGPRIAFLAEYDALPGIGHGCGHNLIGAASAGAAVILSKNGDLPGEVLVIGTPAEETSGAKVTLVEQGIFTGIDAAMMVHPGSQNVAEISTLALDAIEFTFHGRAAHAVAAAKHGINALDALIDFFVAINTLKKQLPDHTKVNGIITEGGVVPNIIPEIASARFYLRSGTRDNLDAVREQVVRCAQGAAARVGAQVTWRNYEFSYDEMQTNKPLAQCFVNNLKELGINHISSPQTAMGSVDMGNVSRVVPAIHPYLMLGLGTEVPHTHSFTQAVTSADGERLLMLAIRALAYTGWDVLNDAKLLQRIQRAFRQKK